MLQEEQISKLTKLKELLDAGILNEEEFAKEKAKIMSNPERYPSTQPKQEFQRTEEKNMSNTPISLDTVGPANVGLSSGIVLPLGILAIISSLISAIFTGLDNYSFSLDPDYFDNTYSNISEICTIMSLAAELILWICAFNKLSTMSEGKRLGRIPLWTYLFLGAALLSSIVSIADPLATESPVILILSLAALAFGFVAYISLYKAYSGKMRTYSIVWMIGMAVSFIMALVGADLISTIIETGVYVFLMIALLEKEEALL